jgi:hypothetical protein
MLLSSHKKNWLQQDKLLSTELHVRVQGFEYCLWAKKSVIFKSLWQILIYVMFISFALATPISAYFYITALFHHLFAGIQEIARKKEHFG